MKNARKGQLSYWDTPEYKLALKQNSEIIIIMLGTNDAAQKNIWSEKLFKKDYIDLIKTFQSLPSKPTLYLCIPPPHFSSHHLLHSSDFTKNVNLILPILIPTIANECNVEIINNFDLFEGKDMHIADKQIELLSKYSNDGIHLNDKGYLKMANNIANKIISNMNHTHVA